MANVQNESSQIGMGNKFPTLKRMQSGLITKQIGKLPFNFIMVYK